jgi:hypothetical protein
MLSLGEYLLSVCAWMRACEKKVCVFCLLIETRTNLKMIHNFFFFLLWFILLSVDCLFAVKLQMGFNFLKQKL